mgnify:CR=1 FL=1
MNLLNIEHISKIYGEKNNFLMTRLLECRRETRLGSLGSTGPARRLFCG